ncbi:uncharacterized protein LOC144865648 [Branchiostoma floridae x Branchiostoma japonicum]
MSRQQEFICGLSYNVTIAVLPRLNMEELMFELNRRIQNLDKENSVKDRLVSILRDVMLEEYRQWERKSQVSCFPDETTIPVQDQETATMQEDTPTSHTNTMPFTPDNNLLDTNHSVSNSYTEETFEEDEPCEETPTASCVPIPDHVDVCKWECHVSKDDHIRQISPQSNLGRLEQHTDDTHNGCTYSGYELSRNIKREETPSASCQPTPDQDCEDIASLLPDNDSRISSKRYVCDVCGFKTSFAHEFSQHKKSHQGGKPFICGECDYRTLYKTRLVEHMRTHTGEKPFTCDQCDFSATCKSSLVGHMKKHTGSEPYRCKICDYQTYTKFQIKRHMMRHSGLKPYKCEECDYRTAQKPDLTRHKRRHTGERPYSCQECDYKATVKSNLLKHMRNKHQ